MRRLALLATVAVVAVSGCGSDGGDDSSPSNANASAGSGSTAGPTTGSDEVDPSMGRQGVGGLCANEAMMPDGGIYTASVTPYEVDANDKDWLGEGQAGALLTMSLRNPTNTLVTADSSEYRLLVGDDEVEAEILRENVGWDSRKNGTGFLADDTAAAGETITGTFIFKPSEKDLADKTAVVVLGGGERICAKVS